MKKKSLVSVKNSDVNVKTAINSEAALQSPVPLLLSIFDEVSPLLREGIDRREILGMAGFLMGAMNLEERSNQNPEQLREKIEQKLLQLYGMESESIEMAKSAEKDTAEAQLTQGRILVVDDSAVARRQIRYFLEREGMEVYEAKSGEEAIWLIDEANPDLLLLDVVMPGMNGMETCQKIKGKAKHRDIPIIFLSAKGNREEVLKGFQAGASDYIIKPFHPAESLSRIRTHIQVKKLAELRNKDILELERLNQTKDRILRVASHDLRNPIAAIAGLTGFLRDVPGGMGEDQKEIVHCIDDAARSVVSLLNDLLDLSTTDERAIACNRIELDFNYLVKTIIPLFKASAERKGIRILPNLPENPVHLKGDRNHLRRVVDNLLSNAIKFTPRDGFVRVIIKQNEDEVELRVEDTGPGIPEEAAEKIFNEFGTKPNAPTAGESSTGLGLSITKRLVEAHNGTIGFTNLPEYGTRFSVILPTD